MSDAYEPPPLPSQEPAPSHPVYGTPPVFAPSVSPASSWGAPVRQSRMAIAAAAFGVVSDLSCCGIFAMGAVAGMGAQGMQAGYQAGQEMGQKYAPLIGGGMCIGALFALVGLILGIVALVRIGQSNATLTGKAYAWAGIVSSALYLAGMGAMMVLGLAMQGMVN